MKPRDASTSAITSRRGEGRRAGFTLIEVLVACAVLVMLVVLVAEMVSSATLLTKDSSRRMDADDEARMVFDRMSGDFAQMIRRSDCDPLFLGTNGNDQLYFYSQSPGISISSTGSGNASSSNSQISIIGYQVLSNGLGRLGIQQSWDDLSFSSNALATAYTNLAINGGATNFHIIAPSVLRMEFALRMKTGSTNNTNGLGPITVASTNVLINETNVVTQTNNSGQSLQDVAEIIVAIAILDQTSQQIVTAAQLSNLADVNIMPDALTNDTLNGNFLAGTGSNGIPADEWASNALQSSIGIPPPARSQIRIYERAFPISP